MAKEVIGGLSEFEGIDASLFQAQPTEPAKTTESSEFEGIDASLFGGEPEKESVFREVGALNTSSEDGDQYLQTRSSGAGKIRYGKPTEDASLSKSKLQSKEEVSGEGQLPKNLVPEKPKNNDPLYNIVRESALGGNPIFSNKNTRERYYDQLAKKGYDRNAIKEIGDVGSAMAGQYQEMEQRLKKDPMDHDALYNMGGIYLATRDYKRAKNAYTKILAEDPKNNMAAKQLGRTALISKDYKEAASIYQSLSQQFPDDEEVKQGLVASLYYSGDKQSASEISAQPGQAPSQLEAQLGYEPRLLNEFGVPIAQKSYTYDTPESDRMKGIVEGLSTFGKMSLPFASAPDLIAPLLPSEQRQYDPATGTYTGTVKDKGLVMKTLESLGNVSNVQYPFKDKPKELIKGLESGAHSALSLMMLAGVGGQGPGQMTPSIGTALKTYAWLYGPGAVKAMTGSDAIEKIAFEPISTIAKPTVKFLRESIPSLRESGFDLPEDEDSAINHLVKLGDVMASLAIIGKGEKAAERLYKNTKYGTTSSRKQMIIQELDDAINNAIDYGVTYDHVKNEIVPGSAQSLTEYTPEGTQILMGPGNKPYRKYANQEGGYVFPAEGPLYPELPDDYAGRLPGTNPKPPIPPSGAGAIEVQAPGVPSPEGITLDDIKTVDSDTPIDKLPDGLSVDYKGQGGFISRDADTGEVLFNGEDGRIEIITGGGDTKNAADAGIIPQEGYYKDKHGEYYVRRKGDGYAVYKVNADGSLSRVYTGDKANVQRRDAIINKALDPERKASSDYTQSLREQAAKLEGDLSSVKGTPAEPAIAKKIEELQKKIVAMEQEDAQIDSDHSQRKTVQEEVDNRISQLDQAMQADLSPAGKIVIEQEKVKLEQSKDELAMDDVPDEAPAEPAKASSVGVKGDVKPIRQLGTGSNVYFESDKHRVNDDLKSGGVLLNIGSKESLVPMANIKFDNAQEAVAVAKELDRIYPEGVPDAVLIDKLVENIKKELKLSEQPLKETPKAEPSKELRVITADELKANPKALEGDPGQHTGGYPESFQGMGTNVKTLESQGYTNLKTGDRVKFFGEDYVVNSLLGDNKKPNTGVLLIKVNEQGNLLRERDKAKPEAAEELVTQEDAMAQQAMDEVANRLVQIEGEFSMEGLKVEMDYDNEIVVLDKDNNILDPEDLPENLRPLAGEYESAIAKLGDYDHAMLYRAMEKARGEEVSFEEVKPELPAAEELEDIKQQIENFGVNKADVEPVHSVISQVFQGLKKAGLTAAKTVGDWVGIGKGTQQTEALKQIIGEKGASRLDNAEKVVADLGVAREMEKAGKTPKEIHLATSWEKGVDGKWRFEVPDIKNKNKERIDEVRGNSKFAHDKVDQVHYNINPDGTYDVMMRGKGATNTSEGFVSYKGLKKYELQTFLGDEIGSAILNNAGKEIDWTTDFKETKGTGIKSYEILHEYPFETENGIKLSEIVDAPELFKAYYELKDAIVYFDKNMKGDTKGGFSMVGGVPHIAVSHSLFGERLKSTIIHEIQHAIQDKEGFAKGGSPEQFKNWDYEKLKSDNSKYAKILYGLIEEGKQKGLEPSEIMKIGDGLIASDNLIKLQKAIHEYENAPELYRKLTGEVESRNAQTRMNMTPEERKSKMLAETEDVAREHQIVIQDAIDGKASVEGGQPLFKTEENKKEFGGFQTRDGKTIGFTYDTDKVARERFDFSKLKKIGSGSDRDVYDLGNGKVVKVAKTARGLTQNIYEGDYYLKGIIPEVFERGLNYVVAESTPSIKTSDKVTVYDQDGNGDVVGETTAGEMLRQLGQFNQNNFDERNENLIKILNKFGLGDVTSYNVLWGDFKAQRNWGYKDGVAYHSDGGTFGGVDMITSFRGKTNLSDPEFREIYRESKKLKKQFGDTDKATMYKEQGGDVQAQYRIESGKNTIEAIKSFDGSPEAVVALTHEIMHPTVVAIIDGAKEGNEVGAKHTETIVNEFNKANPNSKVTTEDLIKGNDAFKDGTTSKQYRAVQEFIAKSWEKYHTEGGKGFSDAFQKVLAQITEAFKAVYKSLSGKQLTPELRKMFDEILGKETTKAGSSRAMERARGEEVSFEEVKPELPAAEELGDIKKGEKKWTSSELSNQDPVSVMQELSKVRPSLRPLMDIAINIHNRLSDIRKKAGGDIVNQLSGFDKDKNEPFKTDLFPFPYRIYSQIFHSTRRTRFENISDALDTFKEKLKSAEDYLENPPSEQELAKRKQDVTDFYNQKIAKIQSEQAAAKQRIEAAKAVKEGPVTEQEFPKVNEDYRNNKFFKAIVDKYKSAKALLGRKREIVIADGSKAKGQYKVVDANDIAPSHNSETYAKTKGVPVDEKGNTLNDRNYEADKQAQALNTERANNFNRKAIDNPIIVTEDGIVISGNDRTMARQKSDKQGTDRDYVDGLIADADMYGIDPAEVQRMADEGKSPTLVFEKEGAPDYSTKEYSKYNESETKGQNPLEKAVALSKKVDSKTTDRISALLDGISNSSDIVGKEVLSNLRKVLVDDGVISKNDIPLYFDAEGKMTAAGKDFLENLVLATVFDEPTLRALDQTGVKSWRGKLANAKFDLMQNSRLGDYNILDFIIDAVGLKKEQLDSAMPLFDWLTQTNMFREPVDPYTAMTMSLLEGSRNAFKDFVKSVNERAKTESVPDMFGEVSTPEQVMTKALKETTLKLDENEKNAIEKLFAVRNEANIRASAEGVKSQPSEVVQPKTGGEAKGAGMEIPPGNAPEGEIKFARNTEDINKIQSELDDLLGEFGSTFEMGGLSKIDKLVPAIAKIVQLGYYKIADVAKYLVEKGLNAALPYLKEAYRTFKNTFNHDAEVKTSLSGEKEINDFSIERASGGLEGQPERPSGGRELSGQPGGEGTRRRPPIRIANKENLPPIKKESVLDGQYDIDETQRFGVNLAMQRFENGGKGFLLADGAGVGKTREILVLANEMQKKTGKPSLVVTLKAVIDDSIKKDSKALGIDPNQLEIGTYDDLTAGKIGNGDYGVVIFDESHNLKNVQSERSNAASKIKRDHAVFASATPMDKPEHAVYFMSEVTGEDPEAIRKDLGIDMVYVKNKEGDEIRSFARFTGGFDTYLARLIDKRNDIIKNGGMVRREYPFFGEINETSMPMPEGVKNDVNQLNDIYDKRYEDRENLVIGRWAGEMSRTGGGNFLQNYGKIKKMIQKDGAMRDQYLSRLREFAKNEGKARLESIDKIVEPGKVDHVFDETQKALAQGKKVVIVVGDVGEQNIKAGSEQKKDKYGYFERKITDTLPVLLKKKFDEAGIKSAEIYGGNKRVGGSNKYVTEMDRFNTGDADVVVMTAKSGGTGINLDDVVGDKPRKMIIATVDYQGDVFEQVIGRVSRRNTASPAEVVMPMMEGATSDMNRKTKVAKKVGLLAAINTGKADMDFERISTRHLMAEEPVGEAKATPEAVDYTEGFNKAIDPNVRMSERSDIFDKEFGDNGEKAKHIYQNYQNILQRLKNASEKGELDITFEGDCI